MAKYMYTGEMSSFYPMFYEFAPEGATSVNLLAQQGDVVDFPEDEDGVARVPPGPWTPFVDPGKNGSKSKPKTSDPEKVTE